MDRLMKMVVAGVVAAVLLQCAAAQTVYVVGGSLGWGIPPNGAQSYIDWAANKAFAVGDILTFNFATNDHDVLQVPKDSYDACSSDNSIGNAILTGPANITLTSAGDHHFICTFGRHCLAGQKLAITVSGTPGAAPPSTNTPAPPPPPPPATPSPTSSTPDAACAPEPSTSPTASSRPELVPPPPPNSSSSTVFASFCLTVMCLVTAFFIFR